MSKKLILFAAISLIALQSGVGFAAQQPAQTESLGSWFRNAPSRAMQYIRNRPSEQWGEIKRRTDIVTPLEEASMAAGITGLGTMAYVGEKLMQQINWLVFAEDWMPGFYTRDKIMQHLSAFPGGDTIIKLSFAAAAGAFIATYGLAKVTEYYRRKDITREQAVSLVQDQIMLVLSDPLSYPTRSSKIHALLKKNEFLVDMEDTDGIVAQACTDLSKKIASIKPNEAQKQNERVIDAAMSKTRMQIAQMNSLDEQIIKASEGIEDILAALESPKVKAQISTVFRLMKQRLVKDSRSGTFKETSSSGFYTPMTDEEQQAVKKRQEMSPQEWQNYRSTEQERARNLEE